MRQLQDHTDHTVAEECQWGAGLQRLWTLLQTAQCKSKEKKRTRASVMFNLSISMSLS